MKLSEIKTTLPEGERTGWYIIGNDDIRASSGPYASKAEAKSDSARMQWYDERKYSIEYGTEDDDDRFHDMDLPKGEKS